MNSSGHTVAPYGSWRSPLSPQDAAGGATRFSGLGITRDDQGVATIWWSESRPAQQGRTALVAARADDPPVDIDPQRVRPRSRVNEYGGGAFWTGRGHVDWVDDTSQQVMRAVLGAGLHGSGQVDPSRVDPSRVELGKVTVAEPPLSAAAPRQLSWRHASGCSVGAGEWVVVERESHTDGWGARYPEPRNELIAVRAADQHHDVLVGVDDVGGGDFVAAPVVSPDATLVAWLRWDHPDMPWDAAELWAGRLETTAERASVLEPRRVAGGPGGGRANGLDRAVSVCLPEWSPDGRLWWCDDSDGWWHLRAAPAPGLPGEGAGDDPSTAVSGGGDPGEEVGEPRWVAGGHRYAFCSANRVVLAVSLGGLDSLWLLDVHTGERSALPGPALRSIEYVAAHGDTVAVVGGVADRPSTVWRLDLSLAPDDPAAAVDLRPVGSSVAPAWVSLPTPVTFPTGPPATAGPGANAGAENVPNADPSDAGAEDDPVAHALVYLPASGDHQGPDGELPPLLVRIHGGPTAAARPEFSTSVQFWTTRGFAVADVNYRGSTGFGREYRDALRERWGVVDVEDCIAVTRYLSGGAAAGNGGGVGLVDGSRCVIRGGSAGGFTALAAVCFQDAWGAPGAFAAACSLYGVTDLAALAADTHKFESRYLDGLVAPLPAGAQVYRDRSPLFHADRLNRPVLLLQGSDDRVVPPAQAEVLVAALEANDVSHRYVLFQGEGHGFRLADTIVTALTAELEFYGQVLGFEPA